VINTAIENSDLMRVASVVTRQTLIEPPQRAACLLTPLCRQGSSVMTLVAIFVLGLIVTSITGVGALLIGLQEAADPSQTRVEDLAQFEKQMVGRGDP
jgi:hypothetical protein